MIGSVSRRAIVFGVGSTFVLGGAMAAAGSFVTDALGSKADDGIGVALEDETTTTETTTDTSVPDTSMPDTSIPDTSVPDTTVPDTSVPDTSVPDTTVPDTTVPDTTVPDTTVPEPVDEACVNAENHGGYVSGVAHMHDRDSEENHGSRVSAAAHSDCGKDDDADEDTDDGGDEPDEIDD